MSFNEELHSPQSYAILGYIDGYLNKEPFMDNGFYHVGYDEGIKDYKHAKALDQHIDEKVKKGQESIFVDKIDKLSK